MTTGTARPKGTTGAWTDTAESQVAERRPAGRVNFVINYEEGSEPSVQDGEGHSETGLTEAHGEHRPGDHQEDDHRQDRERPRVAGDERRPALPDGAGRRLGVLTEEIRRESAPGFPERSDLTMSGRDARRLDILTAGGSVG